MARVRVKVAGATGWDMSWYRGGLEIGAGMGPDFRSWAAVIS